MIPFNIGNGSSRRHEGHEETRSTFCRKASSWAPWASCLRDSQGCQLAAQSQPLAVVAAGLNGVAPVAVRDIPFDGLTQSAVERARWSPSELTPDLRRVNRVSPVVAGTI